MSVRGLKGLTYVMSVWTIYDRPRDYPEVFVARQFHIVKGNGGEPLPTSNVMVSKDLEPLRAMLRRKGLAVMPRSEGDEPQIVESWL